MRNLLWICELKLPEPIFQRNWEGAECSAPGRGLGRESASKLAMSTDVVNPWHVAAAPASML